VSFDGEELQRDEHAWPGHFARARVRISSRILFASNAALPVTKITNALVCLETANVSG